jgi:hypothetical protein
MQSVTFEYILENYFISKKNKNFEIYISTISVFLTIIICIKIFCILGHDLVKNDNNFTDRVS